MKRSLVLTLGVLTILNVLANVLAAEYSQEDIQRYSAYYSNGMQYLKNQQFSSAIVEFRKVLRFSPYDTTTKEALQNAYFARAQYYKDLKDYKKALDDYKSAYFYAKYWKNDTPSQTSLSLASSCQKEINSLETRLQVLKDENTRLQSAKILKAQGELAASGYDFQLLKTGKYKEIAYENLGNIYKNLNNLSYAMDYFKAAIDINPKNPKSHFLYGVMLDEAGNYEASMEQYSLALEYGDKSPELLEILENKWTQNIVNNPSNAQNYINLGAIYQKQGNFEAAKIQYIKAYQMDSSDNTALYNLASLYLAQNNYPLALDSYNKLLLKKPNDIELLSYKAEILSKLSRYDEAVSVYEKMLSIKPNDENIKAQMGNIIENHFPKEKQLAYMKQKADSNPNNYILQFNYALELHKNKDLNNALIYYKRAQNADSTKDETYINIAQIYLEQKKYPLAKETCQKGLLVMPNNKELTNLLAEIDNYSSALVYENATNYYNSKQYSLALSEYLKIKDRTTDVKMAIASCYWEMNDFKNANQYYLDILSKEPLNKDALLNSAWAYYSLNDINNAKLQAQKLLNIDKANTSAKELLADINAKEDENYLNDAIAKYEKKDYASSLDLLNKILAKDSKNEYALYYKGLNYDEMKKPNEAIKQYKALLTINPNFKDAYYSMGYSYDTMENYKEAILNYQKYLENNKEKNELTSFATSRIKELKEYLDSLNVKK